MRNRALLTSLLVVLLLPCGCGHSIPSVRTLAEGQKSKQNDIEPGDLYVIGAGDILAIDVWKEPELSKQVSVRLDGKISLPLVNDVEAAGLTCNDFRDRLTEKYKHFVSAAVVSVTVVESRSKKIYISGKVTRPGEYVLQKNMTVIQAVSLAGGLTEWADTSRIKLIRKMKGVDKTFRVDYDAIVSGTDVSQNVLLDPDDTIFVP